MQNILLLLAGRFVLLVGRVISFTVTMLVITIFAILRGLWTQSKFVADAWRMHFGPWDGHSDGPMFWTIRIIALLLMLVCLIILSEGLTWLVEWTLRL